MSKRASSMEQRGFKKTSKAGTRIIERCWKSDEVVNLIAAVKKRPVLWDTCKPGFKLPKDDYWREVVNELGLDISLHQAKCKWSALRVTFKSSWNKLNQKRLYKDGDEIPTVSWRYFTLMKFLETVKDQKPTESLPQPQEHSSESLELEMPSMPQQSEVKCRRMPSIPTPPQSERKFLTFMPTPPLQSDSLPMMDPDPLLGSAPSVSGTVDRNLAFCDHILAELRSLPESEAFALRRVLNRAMWDFLDTKNC